ncbi:MAG TPA: low temperature requirement protein A, partial [Actinomycetota bacterium]|nr:low temperature requirement protein A [Actinomycetota bacterium]
MQEASTFRGDLVQGREGARRCHHPVSMTTALDVAGDHEVELEHRVTPLELFFDLVFVFAITQVTGLVSHDPTWESLGRALLVLAALWWAWGAYAWLTNTIDPNEGSARLAVLASMGAMLVAALAVPGAFGE